MVITLHSNNFEDCSYQGTNQLQWVSTAGYWESRNS